MKPKENLLRAIRHQSPEWVPNGMENVINAGPPAIERTFTAGKDIFGCLWSFDPGAEGGTYPTEGNHPVTDIERWREQLTIPDANRLDWKAIRHGWASPELLDIDKIDREQYLIQGTVEMGLFERTYLLFGMEEALVQYLTNPDIMEEIVSAIADYKIRLIELFDDAIDMDILWYGDDWGAQDRMMLPPEIWRKIIKPHTKRIYDCAKKRGIIINQHSCGYIEPIFPDIVEMGADIWNPCQPCNALKRMKLEYGDKICFYGGIDSQHVLDNPHITLDGVRAEVHKRISEMSLGGGYIASPSHGVPYDPEIIAAMNDEINVYGRQVYSL